MNYSAGRNFNELNGLQGKIKKFMQKSLTKLEVSLNANDK